MAGTGRQDLGPFGFDLGSTGLSRCERPDTYYSVAAVVFLMLQRNIGATRAWSRT
jgi:hypothetical protein